MPRGLRNAGALALRYQAQTHGYVLLLTDAYPYTGPVRGDGERASQALAVPSPIAASGAAAEPGGPPDVGLS